MILLKVLMETYKIRLLKDILKWNVWQIKGLMGTYSFVILDTDYVKSALFCSCKSVRVIVRLHEMTCTILQRSPAEDEAVTKKVSRKVPNLFQFLKITLFGWLNFLLNCQKCCYQQSAHILLSWPKIANLKKHYYECLKS